MARPPKASPPCAALSGLRLALVFIPVACACRPGDHTASATRPLASPEHASEPAHEPVDSASESDAAGATGQPGAETPRGDEQAEWAEQRRQMVDQSIAAWGVDNPRVLEAMRRVPRHRYVPAEYRDLAYLNSPLPIGHRQTISQPYIVGLMTQLVEPKPGAKGLDIGTGSGYQAAVLAEIVSRVYSIEIVEPLAREAEARLRSLGYENVEVRQGDGYRGWPEHAPFDVIIVAAAPNHIPQPLVEQLAAGGKMVIPVGDEYQELILIEKSADGTVTQQTVVPVAFVPMTGEAEKPPRAEP